MATNFFAQQETARKNTRYLVVLFALAVFCLIALTNLFLMVFPWEWSSTGFSQYGTANQEFNCLMNERCNFWQQLNWPQMIKVGLFISTVIALVSLFKWIQIRRGGKAIAEMMGGTLVTADSQDFAEQRLVNVVEEMALAANMPVPAVYVLKDEQGINAFAAGFSTRDAVVAVTQGTLDSFSRDQLQGVVAHEFSHILNGDMRLNMKLIAILFGIMFITEVGLVFLRGSRFSNRDRNSGPILLLGLGLVILGSIGTFFGNMIKAAVSRQREFLADAAAVQFTRNPSGIADALKIIGGSYDGSEIDDPHSNEISHLFFGASTKRLFSLFATHPPIEARIRRVDPRWDGQFLFVKQEQIQADIKRQKNEAEQKAKIMAAVLAGAVAGGAEGTAVESDTVDPKAMMLSRLHEPITASAIILCLLHDPNDEQQKETLAALQHTWPALHQAVKRNVWMGWWQEDFLAIVNRSVAGLRSLDEAQYQLLKRVMLQLIQANGRIDMYEWALYKLVRSSMDDHFAKKTFIRNKYRKITDLEKEIHTVLAMLIQASSAPDEQRLLAWQEACKEAGVEALAFEAIEPIAMGDFSRAVNKIAQAYPLLKPRVIKALIVAAKADNTIEAVERQAIIAISAAIDAPLPDVLMNELEANLAVY